MNKSRTRLQRHPLTWHLVYSVKYSVPPINSSLLTVTLHSSVITTLVYNDRKNIQSLSWRYNRAWLCASFSCNKSASVKPTDQICIEFLQTRSAYTYTFHRLIISITKKLKITTFTFLKITIHIAGNIHSVTPPPPPPPQVTSKSYGTPYLFS
jgi:hypothetical protein